MPANPYFDAPTEETMPTRIRSTRAETETFRQALVAICDEHKPLTVRSAYYRAVVAGIVPKSEKGYQKVQRHLVTLRRSGELPFSWLVDNTRSVRHARVFNGVEEALEHTARFYRRDLWSHAASAERVEVWVESDSTSGMIRGVVNDWALPLYSTRGFSSMSFAWDAAQTANDDGRPLRVLYIGDHDPAGLELERATLGELTKHSDVPIEWERIAVTWDQVETYDLPGTDPKKPYGYPLSVEAEAFAPGDLRELVETAIAGLVDFDTLNALLTAEESERDILRKMRPGA